MGDLLVKATVPGARIYALRTTELVQNLNEIHTCSPLAVAAVGRTVSGALLLASTMKDNERITVRFHGDGPLGDVVADAQGSTVRGFVENPQVMLPPKNGKLDVGGGVGAGNLIVTRYLQNAEPFSGHCEIKNGEIASDLTQYLYQSEQTPSVVALGVLVNKDCQVQVAGGYFIQPLPDAEDEVLEQLENNVLTMPYVTELLNVDSDPKNMIRRIATGLEIDFKEEYPVELQCRCTRDKVVGMLAALPAQDRTELCEDEVTEVHCHFCNKSYKFTSQEVKEL